MINQSIAIMDEKFSIADTLPRNMGQETFMERIQSQSLAAHPTIV